MVEFSNFISFFVIFSLISGTFLASINECKANSNCNVKSKYCELKENVYEITKDLWRKCERGMTKTECLNKNFCLDEFEDFCGAAKEPKETSDAAVCTKIPLFHDNHIPVIEPSTKGFKVCNSNEQCRPGQICYALDIVEASSNDIDFHFYTFSNGTKVAKEKVGVCAKSGKFKFCKNHDDCDLTNEFCNPIQSTGFRWNWIYNAPWMIGKSVCLKNPMIFLNISDQLSIEKDNKGTGLIECDENYKCSTSKTFCADVMLYTDSETHIFGKFGICVNDPNLNRNNLAYKTALPCRPFFFMTEEKGFCLKGEFFVTGNEWIPRKQTKWKLFCNNNRFCAEHYNINSWCMKEKDLSAWCRLMPISQKTFPINEKISFVRHRFENVNLLRTSWWLKFYLLFLTVLVIIGVVAVYVMNYLAD